MTDYRIWHSRSSMKAIGGKFRKVYQIARCELWAGYQVEEWPRYSRVVCERLCNKLKLCEVVHGLYTGEMHPGCKYYGMPYVPHTWALLHDNSVFDPTQWYFLKERPNIFIGASDAHDYNGLKTRSSISNPPPICRGLDPIVELYLSKELNEHIRFLLLGCYVITVAQLRWLCAQPLTKFGSFAEEFFQSVYMSEYAYLINDSIWKTNEVINAN